MMVSDKTPEEIKIEHMSKQIHSTFVTIESAFIDFLEEIAQMYADKEAASMKHDEIIAVKYNELIMQVQTKIPGATRHETALRYISEAEQRGNLRSTNS